MFGAGGGGAGGSLYPPMNKVLAPNFDPCTFIFIITIIQIVVFSTELIIGQLYFCGAFVTGNDMAGPSTDCMKWMQAKYVPCIQNGEVWRFLTPALLHAGILHIFTNMVSQTMIGYTCELWWGAGRMAFFYISTAFGATLLSSLCSPDSVSVGASGALLGIIGAYMIWILYNWRDRDRFDSPQVACTRMCSTITWLIIIFMIGISMSGIDNYAHLGGWITGMLLGLTFNEAKGPVGWMQNHIKWIRVLGGILSAAYFVTCTVCVFLVVESSGECWGDLPDCS